MPTENCAVMEALRTSTREMHDAAEQHTFQRSLFKGRLPRESYVAFLSQMLLVHEALERRLFKARDSEPAIAGVVCDRQRQTPYLREDLAFFGVDVDAIEAAPATQRLLETIEDAERTTPLSLLGMHYVVEGSNNGSKFIAVNVARAYELTSDGLRYLNPYGDEQRAMWTSFKEAMSRADFDQEQVGVLVDAARLMYGAIESISDELASQIAA